MSKLLIEEHPLQVLPTLAVRVGLNEAIALQQVHYWTQRSKHEVDGRRWVYNTIEGWGAQFPFWGEATIKRTFQSLVQAGLLLRRKSPHDPRDRTNWYAIDYGALDQHEAADASDQSDPMEGRNPIRSSDQKAPMNTRASELATETNHPKTSRRESAQGALMAVAPSRPRVTVNKKVVTIHEWQMVEGIFAHFNATFGTHFTPRDRDQVSRVVMTLRREPDVSLEEHRRVIDRNAAANRWWEKDGPGPPDSIGVIYSPRTWPKARRCTGVPTGRQAEERERDRLIDRLTTLENASDEEVAAMRREHF